MNKIKIIIKKVGLPPEYAEIEPTLEVMQKLVGGYLECVRLTATVDLWCNEDGKGLGLPFNVFLAQNGELQDAVVGDFFLARHNEEGDTVSLLAADAKNWFSTLCAAWETRSLVPLE